MRAAKTDRNHQEIVSAFRKFGCSVMLTHTLGKGAPDAIVGKCFRNVLVEIKDGAKPPSARQLTSDEEKFHAEWKGLIVIVKDLEDVINVVKALEKC